jgi:FkbH-like protein
MSRFRLRPVLPSERAVVYEWRNDPAVRRVMHIPHIVDQEVHKDWWQTAIADPERRMMILDDANVAAALIMFFDLKPRLSASWGFYAGASQKSGADLLAMWVTVEVAAVAYAFDHLWLEELFCETRETNSAVLLLHDRTGFVDSGQGKRGFIRKCFTRDRYEILRNGPTFAQLSDVVFEDDPGGVRIPGPAVQKPVREQMPVRRVGILGSANWDLVARDLGETYRNAVGHSLQVTAQAVGQYALELADSVSPLRCNPPDFLIFSERFEDLAGDGNSAEARFEAYVDCIRAARAAMPGRFFINDFVPVCPRVQSIAEALTNQDSASKLAQSFNRELQLLASMLPDTQLIPLADLVLETGRRNSDPGKYWFLGRMPFGQALVDRWTSCVAGMIAAGEGRTVRVLVCDLDDTLWSGSAGEGGISLNDEAFVTVQRCLKTFAARGVLLAICSKNEEGVALETLRHPDMVLLEADFFALRINWLPKPENIRSIAMEIGVAENSVMVLDNDPLERAEIRQALPNVITPELPWDVADWPRFLVNHPLLTQVEVFPEDVGRLNAYRIQRMIGGEQSRESVLKNLGLAVEWTPVNRATLARAVQLGAKTNQFNTSSIRYSHADLECLRVMGGQAWTVRLCDRFGGDELIGLTVMKFDPARQAAVIETILLSCRVLGRGLETATLAFLNETAAHAGCRWLEGVIVETERNHPCRDLFRNHNFEQVMGGLFVRDITSSGPIERPAWLTYL